MTAKTKKPKTVDIPLNTSAWLYCYSAFLDSLLGSPGIDWAQLVSDYSKHRGLDQAKWKRVKVEDRKS